MSYMLSDPFFIICMITAVVMLGVWTMMFPPFTFHRKTISEQNEIKRREHLRRTGGRG